MNIHFTGLAPFFFKDTIFSSLTARQKTILIVAAAIFGFLAACYAACRYYLRAMPSNEPSNDFSALEEKEKCDDNLLDHTQNIPPSDKEPFSEGSLKQQMAQAKQNDSLAALNSWKQNHDEKEQTLDAFKSASETQLNAHRTDLKIVILGEISPRDRQILEIVRDYLQAIHGLKTTLDANPLTLDDSQTRYHPFRQYAIETQLKKLQNLLPLKTFFLGFTDHDLYPADYADSFNFIFGVGEAEIACGLFSIQRLKTSSFEETLKRLMKLASHEFSHMRGLLHCPHYVCNMQGANSLQEADEAPLTFCSQDMAKICYLNQWSLKEGYENQLRFFENFSQRYGQQMDFSQEIAHLKRKIKTIDSLNLINSLE